MENAEISFDVRRDYSSDAMFLRVNKRAAVSSKHVGRSTKPIAAGGHASNPTVLVTDARRGLHWVDVASMQRLHQEASPGRCPERRS